MRRIYIKIKTYASAIGTIDRPWYASTKKALEETSEKAR
jgi:hypothetical protein